MGAVFSALVGRLADDSAHPMCLVISTAEVGSVACYLWLKLRLVRRNSVAWRDKAKNRHPQLELPGVAIMASRTNRCVVIPLGRGRSVLRDPGRFGSIR